MHLEDLHTAELVGTIDQHLAVEAARAQERRIEDLRPVGRCDQDQSLARIEAVHLDQELVQRLLFLVVSAQAVGAARAAERIELVDEDDCRRALARLLEQVANATGADADEHLDELGAVDGEKRHAGLARDCAREQRLACSGRPDQQHALRDVSAEPRIALRIL